MIAHFYIVSESFTQNSLLSKREIEERIESLAQDYSYIRLYKDRNKFYVNYDIYDIHFLNNLTIQELLYNKDIKEHLDRDARNALSQIIDKSEETKLCFKQIKELLSVIDEHSCYGLIAFHEIPDIDIKNQIIYNKQNWLQFRRYYLSQYPQDSNHFIEECRIYFPNLFFHERNKASIKTILSDCPIKIVYHLTALNDNFRNSREVSLKNNANRQQVLENFSRENSFDEIASLESNPKRKDNMSFLFPKENDTNNPLKVCCEPHIKLPYKDKDDGSYSTNRRIYFHEGIENIANGRIIIGHIGDHL